MDICEPVVCCCPVCVTLPFHITAEMLRFCAVLEQIRRGIICVSHSDGVLSFTPKKQKHSSSSSTPSPVPLRLYQALICPCSHTAEMTEERKRKCRGSGNRGKRNDSPSTSVKQQEGERKGEEWDAVVMMRFPTCRRMRSRPVQDPESATPG